MYGWFNPLKLALLNACRWLTVHSQKGPRMICSSKHHSKGPCFEVTLVLLHMQFIYAYKTQWSCWDNSPSSGIVCFRKAIRGRLEGIKMGRLCLRMTVNHLSISKWVSTGESYSNISLRLTPWYLDWGRTKWKIKTTRDRLYLFIYLDGLSLLEVAKVSESGNLRWFVSIFFFFQFFFVEALFTQRWQ